MNPDLHQVIVGPYEALARTDISLKEVNWLGEVLSGPIDCDVRVRSTRPPVPATVFLEADGKARVVFKAPEHGVSAGQACVFYQDNRVLGGGWIVRQ